MVFDRHGPLAARIPEYRERSQQVEMANRVAGAIRDNAVLVCEAGTGTGKTFAYLVPALLSAGKVILSTGTKTLQDQLYHRDLPTVRAALNVPVTTALLKGRANYVCRYHLERNLAEAGSSSREIASDLQRIVSFARVTRSGDKSELADVPEESPAWNLATSTRENCLGQACPRFRDCFVMAARREALAADLVVVNHHLFFADVMLKDEGMAELLPACNTVIFDEAHQLPETATLFFGESLSTGQIIELARDVRAEALTAAKDMPDPLRLSAALDKAARDLRLALPNEGARFTAASARRKREVSDALAALDSALRSVCAALDALSERSEGLARCAERARTAHALLERWRDDGRADLVRWIEVFSHSLRLNATPLSIAGIFRRQARGGRRLQPLPKRDGSGRRPHRVLGQPFRLRRPGLALRSEEAPGSEQRRTHARGRRGIAAGDPGERRKRLSPVHDLARDAPCSRVVARGIPAARAGISPDAPG